MAQRRLIYTAKWTTAWHHGMVHGLLNTHLPSFDGQIAIKEQWPVTSLETRTRHTADCPELSRRLSLEQPKNGHFWTLHRP